MKLNFWPFKLQYASRPGYLRICGMLLDAVTFGEKRDDEIIVPPGYEAVIRKDKTIIRVIRRKP